MVLCFVCDSNKLLVKCTVHSIQKSSEARSNLCSSMRDQGVTGPLIKVKQCPGGNQRTALGGCGSAEAHFMQRIHCS